MAGVPVRAEASLLLIAGLVAWSFWLRYSPIASRAGALAMALVATVVFFGSILAHELAHALEARRRGLRVVDITLYVFGGATRMAGEAERPGDEFALTVVGPWTSIVSGCAYGLVATGAEHLGLPRVGAVAGDLAWLNLLLGVFNLLPGAPLDGGRLLDSFVWRLTRDRVRAARVSASSGQALGVLVAALGITEVLFVAGGFVGGLWLVLIGWFLLRAASAERQMAAIRLRLRGYEVRDLVRPVPEVPASAPVAEAVDLLARRAGRDVVGVTDADGIVGALTAHDLRAVPDEERGTWRAQDAMTPAGALPSVQATAPAEQLLALVGAGPVAVLEGSRVVSLVTALSFEAALGWLAGRSDGAGWAERPAGAAAGDGRQAREPWPARARVPGLAHSAILGASGILVLAAAVVVPLPLVEVSPGPALSVPALLRTSGPVHPVDGDLLLTSVRLGAPTLVQTVRALLDAHREVLGQTTVVPSGMDPSDYVASQLQVFRDSVALAAAVALRSAGYPVTVTGGGAVVRAVEAGGPSTGVLVPGDVVVSFAGRPVASAGDLVGHLSLALPGSPVELGVRRGDRRLTVRVSPAWSSDLQQSVLGLAIEDAAPLVRLPFAVSIARSDLGGPSAGLMTALAVFSVTTGTDLTHGGTVAGTGTIDAEGAIGPVGGIAEKVAAAAAAGAHLMLVPASEGDPARRAARGLDVVVVPVSSFSGALDRLRAAAP